MLSLLLSLVLALTSPVLDSRVAVTTTDGRVLEGRIDLDQVTIRTIFGEAQVFLDEIDCMTFADHDHIVLLDGTVFAGVIDLREIVLLRADERIVIPRAELSTIEIDPPRSDQELAPPVSVTIVLVDGRKLSGRAEALRFEMKTDFGHAAFDLGKVATIRFGKLDRVRTVGGTTLEGRIKSFKIRLRTVGEVEVLERDDIRSLEVSHLA